MPNYGMPGVAADRRTSRLTGVIILSVIAAIALGYLTYTNLRSEDGLRIALRTEHLGDGISAGSQVRVDGVTVGEVAEVTPGARGTQQIALLLDTERLVGIDDSLAIDYAPTNLFGIAEIELRRGAGGSPLREGAVLDLTGTNNDRVYDATMSAILRSLSQVGMTVTSPQMATVISQLAADFKAFTPLVQALITVSRTIADNQDVMPSELAGKLGPAFDGGGQFASATMKVIDQLSEIRVTQVDKQRYDIGVGVIGGAILPALTTTVSTAGAHFAETTDMLAPMLLALAQMSPNPRRTGADLTALLRNLRGAMPDGPNGPVVNLDVELSGVPGIAVPLLGKAGAR
ncbi:MlaD family protein [Nocardia alba]|uniref:ABC-type transporter Mla subunit MlaD n=1 Tax=Nocardia alba TaxID=225051 RepID=A0A4R1F642_9NOCA|nr:MlaD family protein [Nocardia alba]TCJ89453.1 ABC-type transporter Mla subunit MlaD [Nocardia alba]